jgi:hypothetical protein
VRRVAERDVEGVSTFASALATDRVIAAIRGADADPPRPVVVAAPDEAAAPHQPTTTTGTDAGATARRAVARVRAWLASAVRAARRAAHDRRSA